MKRLTVIVVAAVALVLAGVAGGVVRYTIYPVKNGQFAWLKGSEVYCESQLSTTKLRAFACGFWARRNQRPGTHVLLIGKSGLTIQRWSGAKKALVVVDAYNNR